MSSFRPWPGYGLQSGSWLAGDFNGDGKTDLVHLCCTDYANIWLAQPSGVDPAAPQRVLPFVLEVGEPAQHPDKGRARAAGGVGDADAVGGLAEPDVLFHCYSVLPSCHRDAVAQPA